MSAYTGTISDPKLKTLPKHSGPKVRHNKATPAITRKDLRKKEQERKNPKKRKRVNNEESSSRAEQAEQPSTSKKQKTRKAETLTKAERKDEKENKAFDKLVSSYTKKVTTNQQVLKKWFDS